MNQSNLKSEIQALLLDSSMRNLREFITDLIASGGNTGDEIYQCLYDIADSEMLDDATEAKAENLMDALSGWCAPSYRLGDGNYGYQAA